MTAPIQENNKKGGRKTMQLLTIFFYCVYAGAIK